jgi:hypothetical protein
MNHEKFYDERILCKILAFDTDVDRHILPSLLNNRGKTRTK